MPVRYTCMARPVKSVKPDKPFNDGYRYDDDTEGEAQDGRMGEEKGSVITPIRC